MQQKSPKYVFINEFQHSGQKNLDPKFNEEHVHEKKKLSVYETRHSLAANELDRYNSTTNIAIVQQKSPKHVFINDFQHSGQNILDPKFNEQHVHEKKKLSVYETRHSLTANELDKIIQLPIVQ